MSTKVNVAVDRAPLPSILVDAPRMGRASFFIVVLTVVPMGVVSGRSLCWVMRVMRVMRTMRVMRLVRVLTGIEVEEWYFGDVAVGVGRDHGLSPFLG